MGEWQECIASSRVVPVVSVSNVDDALHLAELLLSCGISVMEITLRTSLAIPAITSVVRQFPEMCVGAGTVGTPAQLHDIRIAGARFAVSPGATFDLLDAGRGFLLPGVATPSEVMAAMQYGYQWLKLFPAVACGGIALLKALAGPFPSVKFVPTGGVDASNGPLFLAQPNVVAIGTSTLSTRIDLPQCISALTGHQH